MVGGAVWVVMGLLDVSINPLTSPRPVALILLIVGLVLSALGLVGLRALQGGSYGRIGLAGLYTALGAMAAQVLGAVALLAGSAALGWLVSSVGLLAELDGFAHCGYPVGAQPSWALL